MGNKQGKLEGADRTDSKKKKTNRSASVHDITGTHNDQGGSGNATSSPFVRDFRTSGGGRAGFKRYQSYAGPSSSGSSKPHGESSSPEGKKSYGQNPASAPTGGRYRSLPRSAAGTSARNRSQSTSSNVYQSNGTLNGEPAGFEGQVTYKRYAHIPASSHQSNLNDTIRPSTTRLNSTYAGHGTGYRHDSNYRVLADDFPDTASIKRRLAQFEAQFVRSFNALYSRLDETVQLDCVPVAFCLDGTSRRQVSLYQYLTSDSVPLDLNDPQQATGRRGERYVLAVPEALFQDAKRIRSQRIRDQTRWLSLAKEIADCVAAEVAEDLSRMFEYQIALLGDGGPVDLLAGHAVHSAVEYVKAGNGYLERSTLIAGVLGGGGGGPASDAKVLSVFVGGREFKWNLLQIFTKCGLRKESLLFGPRPRDSTKFVPWTHHESAASVAQVYGYRGIALDRDPIHGYYVVVREDEIQFTAAAAQTSRRGSPADDSVHTMYCPYRRLIGKEVMDEYCRTTKDTAGVTLGEYVSKLQGYECSRDAIQPVYRPLGMVSGLSKGSRIGTSVSSLLSPSAAASAAAYAGAATTSRASGGRNEERERRPRSQFANGEQTQVPVFVRNNSTSSPNGHSQRYHPRMGRSSGERERGYRSESCSVTSEDFGDEYGGYGRGGEGEGGSTFARHDAQQQRRLYQSQRPQSSKSVSAFNPGTMSCNYERSAGSNTSPIYATVAVNCRPGPGFDQAQTVSRRSTNGPPKSPDSGFNQTLSRGSTMVNQTQKPEQETGDSAHAKDREFLDFKAFLGMIKQDENDAVVPEANPNDKPNSVNGHNGTAKYDMGSSGPRKIGVYSHEPNMAYDHSASSVNDGVYNHRRPALSHI